MIATAIRKRRSRTNRRPAGHRRPRLISTEPAIQLHYEQCLANGCTEKLAEAMAFRQGPALRTDAAFLQGHSNGNQFAGGGMQERIGNFYASRARKAGVSTQGKIYLGGLAAFPGDPKAWVADRGDVEKVLDERGWSAAGSVNRQKREPEREVDVRVKGGVAPDILDREVARAIAKEPEIAPTPRERRALREKIRQRIKPHWVKD